MKVSVIVPVYNAEKYLSTCVDSILNQTHKDLEVILVDDGSEDNSLVVCNQYAQKDDRVKVIFQQNQGPSVARNTGIENATGEYIAFVDSDDYVEPNMYEILLKIMQNNQVQMAMCGYIEHKKKKDVLHNSTQKGLVEKTDIKNMAYFLSNSEVNLSALWNKLYDAQVVKNQRFEKGVHWGEDQIFNYQVLSNINKFYYTNDMLYHYNAVNSYLSVKSKTNYISKSMLLAKKREEFIKNNGYDKDEEILQALYWTTLKPIFAGYFYESSVDKTAAKQNFEKTLDDALVKDALKNFKPQGLMQKLVKWCIKNKKYKTINLLFKFRNIM